MKKMRYILLVPVMLLLALLPDIKAEAFYYEMEYREYQTEKTLKGMDSGGIKEGPAVTFSTALDGWIYAYSEVRYDSDGESWSETVYAEDSYMDKLVLDLTDFRGQVSIVAYYAQIKVPYSLKLHDLSGKEDKLLEPEETGELETYSVLFKLPHFDGYEMEHVEYNIYYDGSYTRRVNLPRNIIGYIFNVPGFYYNAVNMEMNVYYYPLGINYEMHFSGSDGSSPLSEAVTGTMERENQQLSVPDFPGFDLDRVELRYKNAEGEEQTETFAAAELQSGILTTALGEGIYSAEIECIYVENEISYSMSFLSLHPEPGTDGSLLPKISGSVKRDAVEFAVPAPEDHLLTAVEAVLSYNDGTPDERIRYEASEITEDRLKPPYSRNVRSVEFTCLYQPIKIAYSFVCVGIEDGSALAQTEGKTDRKNPVIPVNGFPQQELVEIRVICKTTEGDKTQNYAGLAVENGRFIPEIPEDADSLSLIAYFKKAEKPAESSEPSAEASTSPAEPSPSAEETVAPTDPSPESSSAASAEKTKDGGESSFRLGKTLIGVLIGAGGVLILGILGYLIGRANARKRRKRRNRIRPGK